MVDSDQSANLGGKVGGKVADYLSRAYLSTKERSAGHVVRTGMQLQEEFFKLTGAEIRGTVGPLWCKIADHPDAPDWARNTANFIGRGHGQWQTLLAGAATGAVFAGGIGDLVTNELQPTIGAIIASNPNKKLTPEQAAQVVTHGLGWGADLDFEAAMQGINRERFLALQGLATTVLAPEVIVELYRRGELDQAAALRFMTRAGFDGDHAKRLLTLSRQHLTLADAGAMWNRSVITTDELREIARINGYSAQDADRVAEIGGEPPAPEILYAAFRRGLINEDRLRRGITQGPIRTEWFDVIERMQYHSMTPDSAASAVTQGHMPLARGQQIAQEYGLNPDDFAIIVETSGRPPGVEFAGEAFLRGFLTEDQWRKMFLESAIKNEYIDVLRQMRTRLIPQETARSLLSKGVITNARCMEILKQHGFADDDAAALIAGSTVDRSQAQRDLSLSTVRALYVEQVISESDASAMLRALGYDETETAWELALAEIARIRTYRNAVIGRVRAGYVKGLMDDADASNVLDGLAVPPERRNALLEIWEIERTTVTRDLTPAQIVAAAKKGFLGVDAAVSRLVGQGYGDTDARILLSVSGVEAGLTPST